MKKASWADFDLAFTRHNICPVSLFLYYHKLGFYKPRNGCIDGHEAIEELESLMDTYGVEDWRTEYQQCGTVMGATWPEGLFISELRPPKRPI